MTTAVTTRPVTPHPLCSEFLYLVKAAPAGPLGLMPCAPAELARGVRLTPVPARRPGRGGPDTPRSTFQDDRMPSPGGQVSEMAEKARTLRPCVA
jgi:hypothetical protein